MEPIDIYLSKYRNKKAAYRFFKKCLKTIKNIPESIRTDSHNGYNQIKILFPNTRHHQVKCLNNFAESNHVPIKQRYRAMRCFKEINAAKIFLESFKSIYSFFRKFRPINKKMRNLYKIKIDEFNMALI